MKNINKVLSMLSPDYDIQTIDCERCIYKNYGHYDIEVSGLDNQKKNITGYIFIWNRLNGLKVITKLKYDSINNLIDLLHKVDSEDIDELIQRGECDCY